MVKKKHVLLSFLTLVIIITFGYVFMFNNCSSDPGRSNILLITVDTLRPDHLDTYGYHRETSPAISHLASCGIRFKRALSQAPWTLPSIASILTSLYPSVHGAVSAKLGLSKKIITLAEVLRDNGYLTIGVVSHHFVSSKYGFSQGFDIFDESQVDKQEVSSQAITDTALKRLEKIEDQNYFLWVHYFDPHSHYVRHPEYNFASGYPGDLPDVLTASILYEKRKNLTKIDLEYIKAVYDEEIAYTDKAISKLMEGIRKHHLDESLVTIITSDHGEYFWERERFFHGKDVYNPLVYVPLVISGDIPHTLRGRIVKHTIELRSLPTTIMEIAGINEHPFKGENLLSTPFQESSDMFFFTEGSHPFGRRIRKRAVVHNGWKLIYNVHNRQYELYHMTSDWKEQKNLWDSQRPEAKRMRSLLRPKLDAFGKLKGMKAPKINPTKDKLKHLRSLGYVN
jgi:arylsulfatase